MSQQENPQDSQENSSAPQADSWATPPAANRPADGASLGASIQSAEQTWSAGDGATDFLGLDQDAAGQPSAGSGAAEANPTQAWLFHMESGTAAAAAPQAARAPSPLTAAPEWTAEALPSSEDVAPLAEDELSAGEMHESGVGSESLPEYTGPRSRKPRMLIAASVVATLLAAGGWQYWHSRSNTQSTSTSDPLVWRSTNNTKTPKPKPTPTANPGAETPSVAKVPPVGQPPATDPAANPTAVTTPPADVAETQPPKGDPLPVPPEGQPTAAVTPDQPLVGEAPQANPPPADFTPVAFSGTRTEEPGKELTAPRGTRRPEASEIASLWTSRAIPFDAIGAESQLQTPSVGAIRVLLKNGEHFQGRLHSVGQGYVSMDIALGRMSVDYSEVREIVQILDADLTRKPSNGLPEETAGLLYITAKVPGGYLTGWLVQRAEGKLTLITEQAKKVTIEDGGFEPISKNRARLVGTLRSSTTEAAAPAPAPPDTSTPKLQRGPTPGKAPPKPDRAKPRG